MPTYKNETDLTQIVVNSDNVRTEIAAGKTVQTYKILDAPDWSKVADTPYYGIAAVAAHDISFSGAEWQEQSVDPDHSVFEISTDVNITVHANHQSAPGYPIAANETRQIRHNRNIEKLCLLSEGAGAATITELYD